MLEKFNLLLDSVSLDDKIGHLFVVDIEFDKKMQYQGKFYLMKYYHLSLKKKKFWMLMKDLYINFYISTKRPKKRPPKHIVAQKNYTQRYFLKNLCHFIWKI